MQKNLWLYLNTVRYLKVSQILYRIKSKMPIGEGQSSRSMSIHVPVSILLKDIDDDKSYLEKFDCEGILNNEILLLNERHKIDLKNWTIDGETTHLWMFNLHYMEYLVPVSVYFHATRDKRYYNKVREFIETWISCFTAPGGDAWNAYTISERLPNWLLVMELLGDNLRGDKEFKENLEASMYRQYKYLQRNQEKHLLGNHYLENLKTLIIFGIVFDEKGNVNKYLECFNKEISEQILADGMHFERSFMYHRIIMEDILRVITALQQTYGYSDHIKSYLKILARMLSCTLSFEKELKRIPLFNDAGNNIAKSVEALKRGSCYYIKDREKIDFNLDSLPVAGYYRYQEEDMVCIIDCGEIGPKYIPGHGQCDCLSYELFLKGSPFIVNSGTYQYQSSQRGFFRSTQAHNSFIVNGYQQSQCWGEHRVAKRISKVWAKRLEKEFTGGCTFWNGIEVNRKIEFHENTIIIYDTCCNQKNFMLQSYIHFAPEVKLLKKGDRKYELFNEKNNYRMYLEILCAESIDIHIKGDLCNYSDEFGKIQQKKVIELTGAVGKEIIYKIQWR